MRKMELWLMSVRIRKIWKQVEQNREEMDAMVRNQEAYTSERLVKLNLETTKLGYEAKALERAYLEKLKEKTA